MNSSDYYKRFIEETGASPKSVDEGVFIRFLTEESEYCNGNVHVTSEESLQAALSIMVGWYNNAHNLDVNVPISGLIAAHRPAYLWCVFKAKERVCNL